MNTLETNQRDRQIYNHLEKQSIFNSISNDRDFFTFLEQIDFTKNELIDILLESGEQLTEKEKQEVMKKAKNYEIFLIVDKNDNIIRDKNGLPIIEYRKNCHQREFKEKNIHRASDFLIFNKKGQILLSKRAEDKDTYGWYYETGGGQCGIEWYNTSLYRELEEELNIQKEDIETDRPFLKFLFKDNTQSQYTTLFVVNLKDWITVNIDQDEVVGTWWHDIKTVLKMIKTDKMQILPPQKYALLKYIKQNQELFTNIDQKIIDKLLLSMEEEFEGKDEESRIEIVNEIEYDN